MCGHVSRLSQLHSTYTHYTCFIATSFRDAQGTSKVTQAFTRNLRKLLADAPDGTANKPCIRNVRILESLNDVPRRAFPMWASRVVEMRTMEATGDLDPTAFTQERIVALVLDCAGCMEKMGAQLKSTEKVCA